MKLLRCGNKGSEKAAALDKNGVIRDLSSLVKDFDVNNLDIYTPDSKLCKKYSEKFPIVYGYGHLELYKKILRFYKNNRFNVLFG